MHDTNFPSSGNFKTVDIFVLLLEPAIRRTCNFRAFCSGSKRFPVVPNNTTEVSGATEEQEYVDEFSEFKL